MKRLLTALLCLLAGPALAADLGGAKQTLTPAEAAALPGVPSWTTCYAGAEGGLMSAVTDPALFGMDGWLAGLRAGCDYQMGRFVLGGFGGIDWGRLTSKSGGLPDLDVQEWYFGGRAGFLLSPYTLAYALIDRPEAKISVAGFSKTFDGLGLGGGVQHRFAEFPNVSASLEYQFQKFDGVIGNVDADVHQVRLGVDLHFPVGGVWK